MWDRVPRDMEAVEGMPMAVSDSKSMSTSPGK
jgi:hypothetical protein